MDLNEIRKEIEAIDVQMAVLFQKRMELARDVASYKSERGIPVEDRLQEQRIIEKQTASIDNNDIRSYYVQFIQSTMDISKKWQHRLMDGQKIACSDDADGGGSSAAKKIFPDSDAKLYPTYAEAYNAVVSGECDAAVLPFERSYRGEEGQVLDLMFGGDLHVNGMYDINNETGMTRYAVLSRTERNAGVSGEGSAFLLMFTVRDEVGSLAKAINTISAYNFNMRVMRSRPMRDLPWHYYFYAEALGDDNSENGKRMIKALSAVCPTVKVVGRYPGTQADEDGME